MLSLFPSFFDWSWYVPFVFRIFLGFYFFELGLHMMKKGESQAWKLAGGFSSLAGILFILGMLTQLLGIIAALASLLSIHAKQKNPAFISESKNFYGLLALVSLSLLFLGAGPYAFDLPL